MAETALFANRPFRILPISTSNAAELDRPEPGSTVDLTFCVKARQLVSALGERRRHAANQRRSRIPFRFLCVQVAKVNLNRPISLRIDADNVRAVERHLRRRGHIDRRSQYTAVLVVGVVAADLGTAGRRKNKKVLSILNLRQESFQGSPALCCAFVHARTLQDLRKHLPDLKLDDIFRVLCIKLRMTLHKFVRPIRVFGKFVVLPQIFAVQERGLEVGHFFFSVCRAGSPDP